MCWGVQWDFPLPWLSFCRCWHSAVHEYETHSTVKGKVLSWCSHPELLTKSRQHGGCQCPAVANFRPSSKQRDFWVTLDIRLFILRIECSNMRGYIRYKLTAVMSQWVIFFFSLWEGAEKVDFSFLTTQPWVCQPVICFFYVLGEMYLNTAHPSHHWSVLLAALGNV